MSFVETAISTNAIPRNYVKRFVNIGKGPPCNVLPTLFLHKSNIFVEDRLQTIPHKEFTVYLCRHRYKDIAFNIIGKQIAFIRLKAITSVSHLANDVMQQSSICHQMAPRADKDGIVSERVLIDNFSQ